jgi:hypothetical protein
MRTNWRCCIWTAPCTTTDPRVQRNANDVFVEHAQGGLLVARGSACATSAANKSASRRIFVIYSDTVRIRPNGGICRKYTILGISSDAIDLKEAVCGFRSSRPHEEGKKGFNIRRVKKLRIVKCISPTIYRNTPFRVGPCSLACVKPPGEIIEYPNISIAVSGALSNTEDEHLIIIRFRNISM